MNHIKVHHYNRNGYLVGGCDCGWSAEEHVSGDQSFAKIGADAQHAEHVAQVEAARAEARWLYGVTPL